MERNKLLQNLKAAAKLEEAHTSVVARFSLEEFNWDNVEESKVERVKNILRTIEGQTRQHERMINNLLIEIEEREENDI